MVRGCRAGKCGNSTLAASFPARRIGGGTRPPPPSSAAWMRARFRPPPLLCTWGGAFQAPCSSSCPWATLFEPLMNLEATEPRRKRVPCTNVCSYPDWSLGNRTTPAYTSGSSGFTAWPLASFSNQLFVRLFCSCCVVGERRFLSALRQRDQLERDQPRTVAISQQLRAPEWLPARRTLSPPCG